MTLPWDPLSCSQLLRWIDEFHDRVGRWPISKKDGRIVGSLGVTWLAIDLSLRVGRRGFPGSGSRKPEPARAGTAKAVAGRYDNSTHRWTDHDPRRGEDY
jgi:hypothetical protein